MQKDEKVFKKFLSSHKAGDTEKMTGIIKAGLQNEPNLLNIWLQRAQDLGFQGKYNEADEYLGILDLLTDGDAPILLIRAYASWLQGDNVSTINFSRRVLAKTPGHSEAHAYMGIAQYEMGLFEEALMSFDNAFQSWEGNATLWCGRGMALRALGREAEALECIERALELEPGCALWNLGAAKYRMSLDLFREAILFLKNALALDPELKEAWLEMGEALSRIGKFKEALSCLDKAEGDDSLIIRVLSLKALINNLIGEDAAASNACFDKWLELEPDNPAPWEGKGGQMLSELRCEEAVYYLKRSLELDNSRWMGWHALGTAQKSLGDLDDALASFDRALELNPQYAEAWFDKGNLLIKTYRYREAKPCYLECLKFDEKNAEAWMSVGFLCYMEGHLREALHNYVQCLELKPESDEILNYIGITVGKMGKLKEALYFLEEALERNPDNVEALYNRSCTLAALEAK